MHGENCKFSKNRTKIPLFVHKAINIARKIPESFIIQMIDSGIQLLLFMTLLKGSFNLAPTDEFFLNGEFIKVGVIDLLIDGVVVS